MENCLKLEVVLKLKGYLYSMVNVVVEELALMGGHKIEATLIISK